MIQIRGIFGIVSKEFKNSFNAYDYACLKKMIAFELSMSQKVANQRTSDLKSFWGLLFQKLKKDAIQVNWGN